MIWYEMSYNQPILTMKERLEFDFEEQDKVFAYLDEDIFTDKENSECISMD